MTSRIGNLFIYAKYSSGKQTSITVTTSLYVATRQTNAQHACEYKHQEVTLQHQLGTAPWLHWLTCMGSF